MKRIMCMVSLMVAIVFCLFNGCPAFAAENACKTNCSTCEKSCLDGAKHIEAAKGDKTLAKTLRDCARACKTYAGNGNRMLMKKCKTACDACATACEKSGDAALQQCITDCKSCASSCSHGK